MSTVDTVNTQGNVQPTGVSTDLMIQGDGYFVLGNETGTETYYTRAGVFGFDADGYLVHKSTGLYVLNVNGDRMTIVLMHKVMASTLPALSHLWMLPEQMEEALLLSKLP